jgi:glycosyltransferase A (GT-A) superfamily protein (DUF2064 family)
MTAGTVLVVAKAPVAGQAKTRIAEQVGSVAAADLAAAALLDVLAAVTSAGARLVVALTGDLASAARPDAVAAALAPADVFPQRGDAFADRLAAAHADARDLVGTGPAILQVGMDTPQLTPALLRASLRTAATSDAVLGPADDGGWWALAVRDPAWAEALRTVTMSRADTGERTLAALQAVGAHVTMLPTVRDVDTWADAQAVAALTPDTEFAAAVAAVAAVAQQSGERP